MKSILIITFGIMWCSLHWPFNSKRLQVLKIVRYLKISVLLSYHLLPSNISSLKWKELKNELYVKATPYVLIVFTVIIDKNKKHTHTPAPTKETSQKHIILFTTSYFGIFKVVNMNFLRCLKHGFCHFTISFRT